jgi:AraC-like DNA-binding protein
MKRPRRTPRTAAPTPSAASAIHDFARYLPIESDAVKWGIHVIDCGRADVPPGAPYPKGPHPSGYLFTWKAGRRLNEFQVVYVSAGRGIFQSRSTGPVNLHAGHVLLLFPGEWHRYRPLKPTGWTEHWIGFDGTYARHIMENFFSPARAALRVGMDDELLGLMQSVQDLLLAAPAGWREIAAARTVEILARIRSLALSYRTADRKMAEKVHEARCALLKGAEEFIDLRKLAAGLGMSYSSFRSTFRKQTGSSPRQYQILIRLNKARALLTDTDIPVADVAQQTGFGTVFYFSRIFRKKCGLSPLAFRRRARSAPQQP